MITTAYIKSLPESGSNKFTVRVPYFEDNTGAEAIFIALLCSLPGLYGGYEVGDCVYVMFEGDTLNYPVIVGRLYTKVLEKELVLNKVGKLEALECAVLPTNTKIGLYSAEDFFKLYLLAGSGINNPITALDYIIPHEEIV